MATWFCTVQSFCTIVFLEFILMLGIWVGDNLPPIFSTPPKICDVTNSSIVRKLIQKNWSPILNRRGVSLPIECPFNLSRDIHGVRESIKTTKSSHWQCRKCGKKFYFERFLDLHIERRHGELVNKAEDSVCLGSFCDIMRCDVLMSTSFLDDESKSTDVSVWTPMASGGIKGQPHKSSHLVHNNLRHISHHGPESSSSSSSSSEKSETVVEQCDESYYARLRSKCLDLVWDCLQGLIPVLDTKEFKSIQNELESVSCSYLSCSRYGDKCCPPNTKVKGKLRPFFIVFGSVSISLCLALAYYFTWVYTQSNEGMEDPLIYEDDDVEQPQAVASLRSATYTSNTSIVRKAMPQSISAPPPPLVNRTTHL